MVHILGRWPCKRFLVEPKQAFCWRFFFVRLGSLGAWWKQRRYTALEGVISHNGRGLLGTVPDSCPAARVSIHLSQTADPGQPQSLTRWQRRWSVAECRPRVAIYLANTAHTPKATILQQAWFCYSSVVKAEMMEPCRQTSLYSLEWKSDANREDFFLCVWVLSVDLLWYSAVVSDSDVSTKKGHCGIWKQLYSYFSLYLRSALRMPNCLLGCFHKSCHGAANPVFIHWLLALM